MRTRRKPPQRFDYIDVFFCIDCASIRIRSVLSRIAWVLPYRARLTASRAYGVMAGLGPKAAQRDVKVLEHPHATNRNTNSRGSRMARANNGQNAPKNKPILSSEAAGKVRTSIQKSAEIDCHVMIAERSFWRRSWPVVLIVMTLLNVIVAADFNISTAMGDGPPILWGLNRSEWIAAATAGCIIIAGRGLMVLASDDLSSGLTGWQFLTRIPLYLVIAGCLAYSVFTFAAQVGTGIQTKIEHGRSASAQMTMAADVVADARTALAGAEKGYSQARQEVLLARSDVTQRQAEYERYQANTNANYTGNDRAWMLNATHSKGPARPYVEAIEAAREGLKTAQERADRAGNAVADARTALLDAQRNRAAASTATGATDSVLGSFGESVPSWLGGPWSVETVVKFMAILAAVLIEFACFAGAGSTARAIRESLTAHEDAKGDVAEQIRKAAAENARKAATAEMKAARVDLDAVNALDSGQPLDLTEKAPSATATTTAQQAKHADKIADAIADARSGNLDAPSIRTIRERYKVPQPVAQIIRDGLVNSGLFIRDGSGALVRV